jgi:hypothetical protein
MGSEVRIYNATKATTKRTPIPMHAITVADVQPSAWLRTMPNVMPKRPTLASPWPGRSRCSFGPGLASPRPRQIEMLVRAERLV